MRVVQLGKYYHPYFGGIESHLRVIATELRHDVDLDVVVSNVVARTVRDVVDGVSVTRCASFGAFASIEVTPSMALELSARAYDVMHLHVQHPVGVASYLASRKRQQHRLVVSYHSDIFRQQRLAKVYLPLLKRVLDRADVVLCASPQTLEYSDVLAPFREKCRIVPYGIDLEQYAHSAEAEAQGRAIRARYGGGPLLLGVGRLVYYKGFEFAIRALTEIPDAKLVIVGGGPLLKELQALARKLGVAERVVFTGLEDGSVTPYYLACDLLVFPSIARSEAFGLVQVEAMACERPVVNTALDSGVPYVSPDGESGLTVPARDAPALAAAIRRLLADRDLRARLGAGGKARAHAEFSKATLKRRLLAIYEGREPD